MHILQAFRSVLLIAIVVLITHPRGYTQLNPCSEGCPKPTDITVSNVTDMAATIAWNTADTVTQVVVTVYLLADSSAIFTTVNAEGTVDVINLDPCSGYGVELMAECGTSMSDPTEWLTFKADGCCRTPTAIAVAEQRDSTATLTWDLVATAMGYQVRIRPDGAEDDDWEVFESEVTGYSFAELENCSGYETQVRTVCEDGALTDWSETVLVQTTDCGICLASAYCQARGIDATRSWIDSISFANLRLKTGQNDGYFFGSAEQTALERGRSYDLFIAPGVSAQGCSNYVGAWIDLDQDGMFNDSTEVIVNEIDTDGMVIAELQIADTLVRGITRFRVSVVPVPEGDTLGITACGVYDFGEVEDYCIRIDEPCPAPENIDTLNVGEQSATITWDKMPNAFGYLYRNTELGESPGDFELTGDTIVSFDDLKKCTEYMFEITSVCQQDSNSSTFIYETKCETSTRDLTPLLEEAVLFPNPFSESFNIEFTPIEDISGQLQLISLSGQMISSQLLDVRAGTLVNRSFDELGNAPSGIYLLVLSTDNGVFTRKLVKAER